MPEHNANNERIKRRYLVFLREAKGRDEASIDAVAAAINRFEGYARHRDFKAFHFEQARGFKRHLAESKNARTGQPLSASTVHSALAALKAFFLWLADQPGYASRVKYADAEYFSSPESLARVATAHRFKPCPTLAQIRQMIGASPAETEVQKRDRAIIAFTIVSGARDGAIVSFRLKHIDVEREMIHQDAREVRTKNAKTFTSIFFPVGDDFREIVVEWIRYLREQKGFGPDEPLFPKTRISQGDDLQFLATSLDREPWSNANGIRKVFRDACGRAGLPYFNPHSLRNTLVQVAYDRKLDPESLKAWSQNLGHESCLTTLSSYGAIPFPRQADVIKRIGTRDPSSDFGEDAEALLRLVDRMFKSGAAA
jgi:integrase/recombinase XerD